MLKKGDKCYTLTENKEYTGETVEIADRIEMGNEFGYTLKRDEHLPKEERSHYSERYLELITTLKDRYCPCCGKQI